MGFPFPSGVQLNLMVFKAVLAAASSLSSRHSEYDFNLVVPLHFDFLHAVQFIFAGLHGPVA